MDAVIIAFVSGKGGTGKSTTGVFAGEALAARGKRTLLIELDSGLRSVDIIAGVSGKTVFDWGDVLAGRCTAQKALVQSPHSEHFFVLAAPYRARALEAAAFTGMVAGLQAEFDVILLDTAAGLGESFQVATEVAHRVVLVLTPDPVALRDGRLVADQLDGGKAQLRLLLNRVPPPGRSAALPDLDAAIDTVGVQLVGVVPESPAVAKAAANGTALPKLSLEHGVFSAVAGRLLGEDIPLRFR